VVSEHGGVRRRGLEGMFEINHGEGLNIIITL
jgi:hypothetical protein